jgi:hypothetical protein
LSEPSDVYQPKSHYDVSAEKIYGAQRLPSLTSDCLNRLTSISPKATTTFQPKKFPARSAYKV